MGVSICFISLCGYLLTVHEIGVYLASQDILIAIIPVNNGQNDREIAMLTRNHSYTRCVNVDNYFFQHVDVKL